MMYCPELGRSAMARERRESEDEAENEAGRLEADADLGFGREKTCK